MPKRSKQQSKPQTKRTQPDVVSKTKQVTDLRPEETDERAEVHGNMPEAQGADSSSSPCEEDQFDYSIYQCPSSRISRPNSAAVAARAYTQDELINIGLNVYHNLQAYTDDLVQKCEGFSWYYKVCCYSVA